MEIKRSSTSTGIPIIAEIYYVRTEQVIAIADFGSIKYFEVPTLLYPIAYNEWTKFNDILSNYRPTGTPN